MLKLRQCSKADMAKVQMQASWRHEQYVNSGGISYGSYARHLKLYDIINTWPPILKNHSKIPK